MSETKGASESGDAGRAGEAGESGESGNAGIEETEADGWGVLRWAFRLVIVGMLGIIGVGGYLSVAHLSGGAFPTFGLPLGGEAAELRGTTLAFWEDIRFKDFEHAATYHAPEVQEELDLPRLMERLFLIKPEALDIVEAEIVYAEVDSTELRARVMSRLVVKDLTRGRLKEQEILLFYERESLDAPWFMNLHSSLQTPMERPARPRPRPR